MLLREEIENDYKSIKIAINHSISINEFDNALKLISCAAKIAYEYNFIETFCDDDFDNILDKVSNSFFGKEIDYVGIENRVVFYDFFCYPNKGLTQQYLEALIELGFEIFYIVENDQSFNEKNDIINLVESYSKGRYLVLAGYLGYKDKAHKIIQAIEEFKPSKAFLHLAPWDIVASLVFTRFNKNILHRYFINLTDHAFWLGKNLIDTNIEFRNYGYQVSKYCRKIDAEKLQLLPYYPILQNEDVFLGMPENTQGKVIGISGGNGYKFLGCNNKFYEWIKYLLNKHPNFCFILVGGSGAKSFFNKKIIEDNLERRFLLIDERKDIFQLLKKCDFFIGSFPFCGGLMTQLAVMAQLPVLAYTDQKLIFNYIEELFISKNEYFKTFENEELFLKTAGDLIYNKENRVKRINNNSNLVIKKEEFASSLSDIIKGKISKYNSLLYEYEGIKLVSNKLLELYLEIENNYKPVYYELISSLVYYNEESLKDIKNKIYLKSKVSPWSNFKSNPKLYIKTIIKKLFVLPLRILKLEKVVKSLRIKKIKIQHQETHQNIKFIKFKNDCEILVPLPHRIIGSHLIQVGKNFNTISGLRLEAIEDYNGQRFLPQLSIGDNFGSNVDCHIGCINKITIGNNVLLASRVFITDHSHGEVNFDGVQLPPYLRLLYSKGPVIIEDNVWIGEGACVLPGVVIGKNSIVGSNAVVTTNVPPFSVVGGVPAKIIKTMKNS